MVDVDCPAVASRVDAVLGTPTVIPPLAVVVMDGNGLRGGPPQRDGWCDGRGDFAGHDCRSREAKRGNDLEQPAGRSSMYAASSPARRSARAGEAYRRWADQRTTLRADQGHISENSLTARPTAMANQNLARI